MATIFGGMLLGLFMGLYIPDSFTTREKLTIAVIASVAYGITGTLWNI